MITDTNPYQLTKLRLNKFREAYTQTKGLPIWIRHLILGLLLWIEDHYIQAKVTQTIDDAVSRYHQQAKRFDAPNWIDDATLTITENPDSSHQLPTLQITAPYITKETKDNESN